jgi:hypothetical protein
MKTDLCSAGIEINVINYAIAERNGDIEESKSSRDAIEADMFLPRMTSHLPIRRKAAL